MSIQRKNPQLPSYAIVKVNPDGSALRNDEVELAVANNNPWYVLATIYGEQENFPFDVDLATQNRLAWNGWAYRGLPEAEQEMFAKKYGFSQDEIAVLKGVDFDDVEQRFQERLKNPSARLPHGSDGCIFTKTYFPSPIDFEKYIFVTKVDFCSAAFGGYANFSMTIFNGNADFQSATFGSSADFYSARFKGAATFISTIFCGTASFIAATFERSADFSSVVFDGTADFRSVHFGEAAYISSATFSGAADFRSATFEGSADFLTTTFSGTADFTSATFKRNACMRSVTFSGAADFVSANFVGEADFRSGIFSGTADFRSAIFNDYASFSFAKFNAKTLFDAARFHISVPQFHVAQLYDDTTFTLPDDFRENWPPLTGEGVMPAVDQQRAYNRLRIFMNETVKTKEEQYFYRQEMRCKMVDATWLQLLIFKMFEMFSDFGCSILRPLIGLLAVVLWGALLIALYMIKTDVGLLSEAWGWSMANTVPIFGFGQLYSGGILMELPAWLTVVSGMQALFGIVMLFLLGLGLRNLFRFG